MACGEAKAEHCNKGLEKAVILHKKSPLSYDSRVGIFGFMRCLTEEEQQNELCNEDA